MPLSGQRRNRAESIRSAQLTWLVSTHHSVDVCPCFFGGTACACGRPRRHQKKRCSITMKPWRAQRLARYLINNFGNSQTAVTIGLGSRAMPCGRHSMVVVTTTSSGCRPGLPLSTTQRYRQTATVVLGRALKRPSKFYADDPISPEHIAFGGGIAG